MSESFNTTRWTIIDRARGDERTVRRDAMQQLLTSYMPVLRAHLVRRKRLSPDLADELLQGFVVKNIVEGELIQRADASAGKFRSWLLKWLDTYSRHELSRSKRETAVEEFDVSSDQIETDSFDADWARTTLAEAVQLMKEECIKEVNELRWQVFQGRLLMPLLSDVEPTDYDVLVRQLHLESKAQAQNHLVSAKRHFQRSLETVIARYSETDEEIASEIVELRRVLSESRRRPTPIDDPEQTISPNDIAGIVQSAPARIAQLYELDVATIWRRCLETRIADLLDDGEALAGVGDMTLRECYRSEQPFEELLLRLKRIGNSRIQHESSDFPVDVGLAIYLTSIAVGQVRLGKWISQASVEILRPGFDFLLAGDWIDDDTRTIHERALKSVSDR